MTRKLALSALLIVAACGQNEDHTAATNEVAQAPATPAAGNSVPLLDGQWLVASIDGKPVNAGSLTASFAGGKALLAPALDLVGRH